jgi:hypothetical protein
MVGRVRSAIAAAGLVLLPALSLGQELTRIDDAWSRYRNARFGTSVDVPGIFMIADPAPANGDGRIFKSRDGAELRVFGSHSATTVAEDFATYRIWMLDRLQKDGVAVTYKAQGKGWLVASGTEGREIVYVKVIEGCDATHEIRMTYPSLSRRIYDPLVGRLAHSLRCAP